MPWTELVTALLDWTQSNSSRAHLRPLLCVPGCEGMEGQDLGCTHRTDLLAHCMGVTEHAPPSHCTDFLLIWDKIIKIRNTSLFRRILKTHRRNWKTKSSIFSCTQTTAVLGAQWSSHTRVCACLQNWIFPKVAQPCCQRKTLPSRAQQSKVPCEVAAGKEIQAYHNIKIDHVKLLFTLTSALWIGCAPFTAS